MSDSKPIPIWARVGAGVVGSLGGIAFISIGTAWICGRNGILPNWPWYAWALFAWSVSSIFPLLLAVGWKGEVSWGKASSNGTLIGKYKTYLSNTFPIALILVAHHYEPIAADLFVILFALITVYLGLQIYFMPVKSKLESIAKTKARHGFPLNQPHKIDKILKSGYFRIP